MRIGLFYFWLAMQNIHLKAKLKDENLDVVNQSLVTQLLHGDGFQKMPRLNCRTWQPFDQ